MSLLHTKSSLTSAGLSGLTMMGRTSNKYAVRCGGGPPSQSALDFLCQSGKSVPCKSCTVLRLSVDKA